MSSDKECMGRQQYHFMSLSSLPITIAPYALRGINVPISQQPSAAPVPLRLDESHACLVTAAAALLKPHPSPWSRGLLLTTNTLARSLPSQLLPETAITCRVLVH